jgi:hypothetical protein
VALTWTIVRFWTDVPSPSLAKTKELSAIRNESQGANNKRVKPHEGVHYLTIIIIWVKYLFILRGLKIYFFSL